MKWINNLLKFIVRWENRNTFCLFAPGSVAIESLTPITRRGIKCIRVVNLQDGLKIIRLGKGYISDEELKEIRKLLKEKNNIC